MRTAQAERGHAARIAPDSTIDLFESALAHYRKGEFSLAAAVCERVSPNEPNRLWSQYLAALSNLRDQRWALADEQLQRCLDQLPGAPVLLMYRSLARAGSGKFAESDADFKNAYAAAADDPSRAEVLVNRSYIWVLRKRWVDAERELTKAIELRKESYRAHVTLAFVYQNQDKRDDAIKEMNQAVNLLPDYPYLYAVRSRMQVVRGDTKAARLDCEKCLMLRSQARNSGWKRLWTGPS